ncbi:DNA-binding protein YbiB [Pigmentiphaga litoralis]|jgi:anthranilate phosphoribosyltransferase|uniref:DNA-binding protein YbiB n=1 Tax=Pigmentiphaga litoralis TaxID=516702 RepID=UPI0016784F98|nr:DNA-binding protein YbiB [Pigmentiphaga litoralis]GGX22239.1 DNA-binding protein YbiB [Pigmentiphaga litoralis]
MSATPFSCAALMREIGRGKDGSRALSREQAHSLMAAIFDGGVSDLELGAVLIALRMKGEVAAEIAGFLDAVDTRCVAVTSGSDTPVVVLPTYNGSRHAPNLVPLLALTLAKAGIPVIMHGQASDPAAQGAGSNKTRITTLEILQRLGVSPASSAAEASSQLAANRLAYLPLGTACPGLARLVGLRRVLGVRNVSHTLAKLLRPVAGPSLLLSAYTHPEFGDMLGELFTLKPQASLLMRGTEGEAVANVRRPQAVVQWLGGVPTTVIDAAAGSPAELPALPDRDAGATANWIRAVQMGEQPLPDAIARQRDAIVATVGRIKAGEAGGALPEMGLSGGAA